MSRDSQTPPFFQFEFALDDAEARRYTNEILEVAHAITLMGGGFEPVITDAPWKHGTSAELGSAAQLAMSAAYREGDDAFDARLTANQQLYAEMIGLDGSVSVDTTFENPSRYIMTVTTQERFLKDPNLFDTEGAAARLRRTRDYAGWLVFIVDGGAGMFATHQGDLDDADRALEKAANTIVHSTLEPENPLDGDVQFIHGVYGMYELLENRGFVDEASSNSEPEEDQPDQLPTQLSRPRRPQVVVYQHADDIDMDERLRREKRLYDTEYSLNTDISDLRDWTRSQGSAQRMYKDFLLRYAEGIREYRDNPEALRILKGQLVDAIDDGLPSHVGMEYVRFINQLLLDQVAEL